MPAVVVDMGNTRMKWGRVRDNAIADHRALTYDSPELWDQQLARWQNPAGEWVLSSVTPRHLERMKLWLAERGIPFRVLDNATFLSTVQDFRTSVEEPIRNGIDRFLGSLAAHRLANELEAGFAAAAISVGTATTLDLIEADGTHIGGAIYPGPALMARSLKDATALLPDVSIGRYRPELLAGATTEEAIHLGITRAVAHAAGSLIHDWASGKKHSIFITGGDAELFHDFNFAGSWTEVRQEPLLTLEGLRLAAGYLP